VQHEACQNFEFLRGKGMFQIFRSEPNLSDLLDLSPETLNGRQQDSNHKNIGKARKRD
jgi:hypothetical protein